MIYEMMRLTLVLCIVVAPVLLVSQVFLMRVRKGIDTRLTATHPDLDPQTRQYAQVPSASDAAAVYAAICLPFAYPAAR